MRIAVIGTGNVGSTLGSRWAKGGHEVVFGVRQPQSDKVRALVALAGEQARAATIPEAVKAANIVLLSVPWTAVEDVLRSAGSLEGKLIIDCTNPIDVNSRGLSIGRTTSGGEKVAEWARGALVVKAFNMTGTKNMANPRFGDERLTMFVCGDHPKAKSVVARLAEEIGFEPCDAGPLSNARYLEPMAILWIYLAYGAGRGQDIGLRLIERPKD
jgi:hypothetical protein